MTIMRFFKLLFCFKKPGVINFSYLPVYIKEKPTLFIVWDIKNVWSVKLLPFNHTYYAAQHATIISIPKVQRQLTVEAANFWRNQSIALTLCPVHLDGLAKAQLIRSFRPLSKVSVSAPQVLDISNLKSIKPSCLKQRNTVIKKIDRFNIQIQRFNYQ